MLERIEGESGRLLCPELADVLVGHEAIEGLEASSEVVGCDEVGGMASKLTVIFAVERLTVASLIVGFMRSTCPLVQRCLGLARRWSMSTAAQVYSKA